MLFPTIKKQLDQQEVTHKTAGEFLQTLKTLMAKLRVGTYCYLDIQIAHIISRQMIGGLYQVHCSEC
jgi:hypothetical protein